VYIYLCTYIYIYISISVGVCVCVCVMWSGVEEAMGMPLFVDHGVCLCECRVNGIALNVHKQTRVRGG
jgi:hypothetical protein